MIRETSEVSRIVKMKNPAILMPSGFSMTTATVVYANIAVMMQNPQGSRCRKVRSECSRHFSMIDATQALVISTSTPVAYAPPWSLTLALKKPGDQQVDAGQKEDQRANGARPFGSHAILRQILWDEIEQAGHRTGPRKPENDNRAQVVDGSQQFARKKDLVGTVTVSKVSESAILRIFSPDRRCWFG